MKNKYYIFIYNIAKKYKNSLLGMGIISNLISVLSLFYPFLLSFLVDYVYVEGNIEKFIYIIYGYIVLFLVEQGLHFIEYKLWAYHYKVISYDLKSNLFEKIVSYPAYRLDKIQQGENQLLLAHDAENCFTFINWIVNNYLMNILRYILHFICLSFISWKLSFILFFIIPIITLFSILLDKLIEQKANQYRDKEGKYSKILLEFFRNFIELRIIGIVPNLSKKISNYQKKIFGINSKKNLTNSIISEIYELISLVFLLVFFTIVYIFIFREEMTIGEFLAAYTYWGSAIIGLKVLLNSKTVLNWIFPSIKRVYDVLTENGCLEEDISENGQSNSNYSYGDIKFEKVSFGYNKEYNIINDTSIVLKENTLYAIVGRSGCGKSTFLKLLCKFYVPNSGEIFIDNISYTSLSEKDIRNNISIVQQDIAIFDGTIEYNLKLGAPDATEEEIIEACKNADILSYIENLPSGFETLIGYQGIEMSVGQKQRLAIARILLKKTKIIVFDEATSALDINCEKKILNKIKALSGVTIIVVTHRIQAIKDLNNIIVFDEDKGIMCGNHQSLINSSKSYELLYQNSLNEEHKDE
jgi:ABC-type multidrug transport system, ATPase and permease components